MTQNPPPLTRLSRREASDAAEPIGWAYLLGTLRTTVLVPSMTAAARVGLTIAVACEPDADEHLRLDLRSDRIEVSLQTRAISAVTQHDVSLAQEINDSLADLTPAPNAVPTRPVEALELAIDAFDIAAIRPFWKAVLAYAEEPGRETEADSLVDPAGQLPTIWFQQMDEPRVQRNRIHFDLTVTHDAAEGRIAAALEAGGQLLDGSHARAFWVLADAEGNEVCVCTWQDRDARQPIIAPTDS